MIILVPFGTALYMKSGSSNLRYRKSGSSNLRYIKDPGTPESWQHDQENKTVVSPQEKSPRQKIVTIDFSFCSKGNDSFGFGFGSTSFYFDGIEANKCHFYMGTEIENPNWDGYLNYECNVPTDYKKEFAVKDSGADLIFVNDYCSK